MDVLTGTRVREDRGVDSVLQIYDLAKAKAETVAEMDGLIEAPNWTPDGRGLVYNGGGRLFYFDLEKRGSKEIDTGFADNCNNDHVLSSDGKGLAVSHGTWEDGRSRIYTLPFAGGTPALITPIAPSFLHGWSPDGKTLAYTAERNGVFDIHTIPVTGGVETRLTDTPGLDDGPEYSADGKHIWFCSTRTGLMQAWRMNADGTEQTQMTFDEANNWFPHISPDGSKIVFISYYKDDVKAHLHPPNKNVRIRCMSANGGEIKTLVDLFGGQGTINVNSWSPDSAKFAFVSYKLKEAKK